MRIRVALRESCLWDTRAIDRREVKRHIKRSSRALLPLVTVFLMLVACGGGSSGVPPGGGPSAGKDALYLSLGGQILTFDFDSSTGVLGSPTSIPGPRSGFDMKADISGRFLYTTDFDTNSVYAYSINTSTGALTQVNGSPFLFPGTQLPNPGNGGPLVIDPAGKYLFYSDAFGAITSFVIDANTGALTASAAPVVHDDNQPLSLVINPAGKFLFTSNHSDPSGRGFSVFSIDSATGALSEIQGSPFTFGQNVGPAGVVLNGDGSVLYAALNAGQVAALNVNSTTGALSALPGSPFPAQFIATSIALTPSGKFLYVGNVGVATISGFSVDSTSGVLTPLVGFPFQEGNPSVLAVSTSGEYLFVIGATTDILSVYRIDSSTGSLSVVSDTSLPAMSYVRAVTVTKLQ
jgi:6-phosphogluconolactonase